MNREPSSISGADVLAWLYGTRPVVEARTRLAHGASPTIPRLGWGMALRKITCRYIGHHLGPPASDGFSRCVRCLAPVCLDPGTRESLQPLALLDSTAGARDRRS